MQKNFEKVHFLNKFCPENTVGVTQPLNFFVQKSSLDVCVIMLEFQKNCSIRFKNSFLAFEGHFLLWPETAFNAHKTKNEPWGMTFQKRCVTLVNLTYINAFSSIENFLIFAYF